MRLLTLLTVITLSSAHAELKLHPLFSDHAVLQSGPKLPIWGWGTAGEEVSVSLAGKSAKTKVDEKGKWRVELEPISPGGPHMS
jgi:sialate O-acetylesterase